MIVVILQCLCGHLQALMFPDDVDAGKVARAIRATRGGKCAMCAALDSIKN